ncbi:TPA: hypothetical protein QCV77_006270 [Bacillus thuringiensis]|nr:hypothetical protein [Bacillus thuringiensis]
MKALENWELIQKWETQAEKAHEMNARYKQNVVDADAEVREATVKYEMLLRKEFEGGDVVTEKKKALEDIEKAKAALKVAEEESGKAYTYSSEHLHGNIMIRDLVNDFIRNVVPQIEKENIYPVYVQLEQALFNYYDALAKMYNIREEIRPTVEWLNEMQRAQPGPSSLVLNPAKSLYLPRPTNENLKKVEDYRRVPEHYTGLTRYEVERNVMEQYREAEKKDEKKNTK